MSEIKVGDWIRVKRTSVEDRRRGVSIGDKFEVIKVVDNGVIIQPNGWDTTIMLYNFQLKKVEPPVESAKVKTERVASGHYQNANNNDVWQFADDNLSEERVKGFHQVNAIKYVTRYHIKHDTIEKRIEDLEKAKVYIDKLIELERQA